MNGIKQYMCDVCNDLEVQVQFDTSKLSDTHRPWVMANRAFTLLLS